jgi:murein DD-endopeptidase MepM/ murein hydrolase activator NlpD
VTNNTGNSTGCHLHFEVRPKGGGYGTDVDPSVLLLDPSAANVLLSSSNPLPAPQNPYNALDPRHVVWDAEQGIGLIGQEIIAGGQVALGSLVMLGGLVLTGYGLRGKPAGAIATDSRRLFSRRPAAPARRRPPVAPVSGAERTRIRLTHQRNLPPAPPAP